MGPLKLNLTGLTPASFLRCLEILGYARRLRALADRGYRDRLRPGLNLDDLADQVYLAVRQRDNGRDATQAIDTAARILRDERDPPKPPEPEPRYEDPRPGSYYVSVIRDGHESDYRLLRGPFLTHAEALDRVDETQALACKLDPRGVWYAYGTCRLELGATTPGLLNEHFGG